MTKVRKLRTSGFPAKAPTGFDPAVLSGLVIKNPLSAKRTPACPKYMLLYPGLGQQIVAMRTLDLEPLMQPIQRNRTCGDRCRNHRQEKEINIVAR